MNKIIEKENIIIEDMIYEIREKEVMLDSDIAKLYQVETKRINEAVKNNPEKFPKRFSFRIMEQEYNSLKSKISTLEIKGQGKYSKYVLRVFTEQGVYMLATILKSKVATEVSIAIMDTFVKMRHYINYNKDFLPHRFIILDRNKLFSCGASFKDLGKKCFEINEFYDETYLNGVLKKLFL